MKTAILLVNLGSPDSPKTKDVKRYLKEFLMDERVIDLPKFWRSILVKGIIAPLRAPKSASKYARIWTDEGAPLIAITEKLTKLVSDYTGLPGYYCMRYANPSPKEVLSAISKDLPDLTDLVLIPLYPHYAMSSYETAVEHVIRFYKEGRYAFKLHIVPPFYRHPSYLNALAESIKPFLHEDFDHILFSYHGVPVRHIFKSDITGRHCLKVPGCCSINSEAHKYCYLHQIKVTTEKTAQTLSIPANKYSYSFQSRLGTDQWLQPYTVDKFKSLPKNGVKKLLVVSPAFVADCLETLEELEEEGKEIFLKNGGEKFTFIPCLNTNKSWIETLASLVDETITSVLTEK